ncbi:MAG: hypothetical protein AAF449_01655 [Myxococcota bacterium]
MSVLVRDVISGEARPDVTVLFTDPNDFRQQILTGDEGRALGVLGADAAHVYVLRDSGFLHVTSFVGIRSTELVVSEFFASPA